MRMYVIHSCVGMSVAIWARSLVKENESLRVQRTIALEVIGNHAKLARYLIDMLERNSIDLTEFDDIVLETLYEDLMKIKGGGA